MKKILKGIIRENKKVARDTFKLVFESGLEDIKPGQFLSILCPPKTLRRPFGVYDFEGGVLSILFRLRGEGTKYLKNLKAGDEIDFNAPLGNGFAPKNQRALLVGAGIGVAPLIYLNKKLKAESVETKLICGFKSDDEVIDGCDYVKIGGTVVDEVERLIDEFKPEVVYCCAPQIVLKLVSEIAAKKNIEIQVAMERVMACGIGVCRGCVIKIKTENGIENRTVCKDGPVFLGDEVIWE